MSNKKQCVLYIGVTNDLLRRVYEHKKGLVEGFTKKYHLDLLVWYEIHEDITEAIKREKKMKNRHRSWKIDLIVKDNPEWNDLYGLIVG